MNYSISPAVAENATVKTNKSANLKSFDAAKTHRSPSHLPSGPLIRNKNLLKWVEETAALTQPAAIHWVDGTQAEYERLCADMVASGTFIKLNEKLWPGCYYAKSDPTDVARVEDRTYICSLSQDDAGPSNNWVDPSEMRIKLKQLFEGCMRGRTLYVLPFSMGPIGSPLSQIGVQLTDSPYAVVNMRIMARIGLPVLRELDADPRAFVPCIHSVGAPLQPGEEDVPWPCNRRSTSCTSRRVGRSGVLVRVTAATPCWAKSALPCGLLRASAATRDGWRSTCSSLASKIPKVRRLMSPRPFRAPVARPISRCLFRQRTSKSKAGRSRRWETTLPGSGPDADGQLRAINPEAGFFGVAPGTSAKTNPNAMATLAKNTIFTNVALTPEGGVWWEGMTDDPPAECLDWQGKKWTPEIARRTGAKAAHPNASLHRSSLAVPDH